MSNFVFVLDANKQPLDPVPLGQARRLLKQGKAAIYRQYPFTIILKYAVPDPKTKPLQLKLDPGYALLWNEKNGNCIVTNHSFL